MIFVVAVVLDEKCLIKGWMIIDFVLACYRIENIDVIY